MATITKEEIKELVLTACKDYHIMVNDRNVVVFFNQELNDFVVKFTVYHPEYFETYTYCLTSGNLIVNSKFHVESKESTFTGEYIDCFYIHRNSGETLQIFCVGTDGSKIVLEFSFLSRKTIQSLLTKFGIKK